MNVGFWEFEIILRLIRQSTLQKTDVNPKIMKIIWDAYTYAYKGYEIGLEQMIVM